MTQPHPPTSQQFDDVYFSAAGGLTEVQHVFHGGNNLAQRFQLAQQQGLDFIIGELGFGTGLAYAATAILWQELLSHSGKKHKNAPKLVYVSLERYLLQWPDLWAALAPWPAVQAQLASQQATYQQNVSAYLQSGNPRWLKVATDQVQLILGLGDVATVLPEYPAAVDAWFLDGFTPAKNPAMWAPEVLATIGQKTKPAGTVATFTAASAVRHGLAQVGFNMQKVKGFAHKREMLIGNKI